MKRIVKKPEERRKEIVDAAAVLFDEKGYEAASMKELMERLGVAKGTIYHYFRSKEDLLEAVVEDVIDQELERQKTILGSGRVEGLSALALMERLIGGASVAQEHREVLKALHGSGAEVLHVRQLGCYIQKLAPLFADVIQQGCDEGVFDVACPLETAEFLLAGLQFITDVGFYSWTESDIERRKAAFSDLVAAQLGAEATAFAFLKQGE